MTSRRFVQKIVKEKEKMVIISNIFFALISSHSRLIEIFTEYVRILSDVELEPFDWLGRSYSESLRDLARKVTATLESLLTFLVFFLLYKTVVYYYFLHTEAQFS